MDLIVDFAVNTAAGLVGVFAGVVLALWTARKSDEDPYLFQSSFEIAVWDAAQIQFMRLASLDERVLLSRFFNQVNRLTRLMEFHRQLRVQLEMRQSSLDAGDRALLGQSAERLRVVADDVRIDGLVVVTDLGEPMHKRLLGIKDEAQESAPSEHPVAYLP